MLDFSTLLPGPFASLLLADMGADVCAWSRPGAWTWCGCCRRTSMAPRPAMPT
ncbi:hypothetical protein P4054_20360 [Pseudomonas aeruginosa]|nr:hypothetical protein [Pseudomonas aeruginosa]